MGSRAEELPVQGQVRLHSKTVSNKDPKQANKQTKPRFPSHTLRSQLSGWGVLWFNSNPRWLQVISAWNYRKRGCALCPRSPDFKARLSTYVILYTREHSLSSTHSGGPSLRIVSWWGDVTGFLLITLCFKENKDYQWVELYPFVFVPLSLLSSIYFSFPILPFCHFLLLSRLLFFTFPYLFLPSNFFNLVTQHPPSPILLLPWLQLSV